MPKGSSKNTAAIERLLDERRQYEAWIARLSAAQDATPAHVRERVKADYEARLKAVTEELKAHGENARQALEQRRHVRAELQKKEALAAEKLAETELRHAVGEYDKAQWSQVHADALAELVSVREELQAVNADVERLEELDALVRTAPRAAAPAPSAPAASPPSRQERRPAEKRDQVDELAFIKSVTEDEKGGAPSPKRASGAQFQPVVPGNAPRSSSPSSPSTAVTPTPRADEDEPEPRTLKCRECGTMNLPTEWYCEQCGAELAAL